MRDFIREPITESITIAAPIERCFALSTRVELVKSTLGMQLVDDPAADYIHSGHVGAGSRVHWYGWKFGLPTHHHTLITGYAAPHAAVGLELGAEFEGQAVAWFQDSQAQGRFAFFRHDHFFREGRDGSTRLDDEVRFRLPFGVLGGVAAELLAPHIRRLARQRFGMLKELAEGNGWRRWVDRAEAPVVG
jgi:ligand-binding SRPBCC domain-containing protein